MLAHRQIRSLADTGEPKLYEGKCVGRKSKRCRNLDDIDVGRMPHIDGRGLPCPADSVETRKGLNK